MKRVTLSVFLYPWNDPLVLLSRNLRTCGGSCASQDAGCPASASRARAPCSRPSVRSLPAPSLRSRCALRWDEQACAGDGNRRYLRKGLAEARLGENIQSFVFSVSVLAPSATSKAHSVFQSARAAVCLQPYRYSKHFQLCSAAQAIVVESCEVAKRADAGGWGQRVVPVGRARAAAVRPSHGLALPSPLWQEGAPISWLLCPTVFPLWLPTVWSDTSAPNVSLRERGFLTQQPPGNHAVSHGGIRVRLSAGKRTWRLFRLRDRALRKSVWGDREPWSAGMLPWS